MWELIQFYDVIKSSRRDRNLLCPVKRPYLVKYLIPSETSIPNKTPGNFVPHLVKDFIPSHTQWNVSYMWNVLYSVISKAGLNAYYAIALIFLTLDPIDVQWVHLIFCANEIFKFHKRSLTDLYYYFIGSEIKFKLSIKYQSHQTSCLLCVLGTYS